MGYFGRKGSGCAKNWAFGVLGLVVGFLATSCVGGSRDLPPEWYGVGTITRAVLAYAEAHDSRLPASLDDVDQEDINLREGVSIDMFIYVAPEGNKHDFPPNTPILIFPWEEGIIVGYLNGHRRFIEGGYGKEPWRKMEQRLVRWKIAFGGLFLVSVIVVGAMFCITFKKYFTVLEVITMLVLILILAASFIFYVVVPGEKRNRDLIIPRDEAARLELGDSFEEVERKLHVNRHVLGRIGRPSRPPVRGWSAPFVFPGAPGLHRTTTLCPIPPDPSCHGPVPLRRPGLVAFGSERKLVRKGRDLT